ncbi:MAG: sulfatase-like hydrolase/transferase [Pirellulaceae bacterium]|nr:sulfatase-like hydrolase/transferase [Pirellulaceae bacterium]
MKSRYVPPALLSVAVLTVSLAASDPPRPNLLLLFVDNVGYGDLGCYGNRDAITPRIDRLASEGVRCLDFYIASPSCSPSRGAILTGRHPERNGLNYQMSSNVNARGEGLPVTERILPQYLKPLGYACGAFGKWNIGFEPGQRPTERGFDEFLGHQSGNIHYYKHLYHGQNDMRRGTEAVDLRGQYSTDVFADAACDFIGRCADQSWFVYLPFNAAHFIGPHNVEPGEKVQWQAPASALARHGCRPDEPDQRKRFHAVLTALDDAVGRVLDTVDGLGLRERTLVMFISDNGAFMLPGRGLEVQSNAPLRGGGVTVCEGGVRVPAVFRWPGHLPAGEVNRVMLSSLDIVPLAMSVAGGTLPGDRVFDGRDPLPALQGKSPSPHDALHWIWNQGRNEQWRGMREGDFKLLRASDRGSWQLFDLSQDIGEQTDLAASHPQKLQELVRHFGQWQADIAADRGNNAAD